MAKRILFTALIMSIFVFECTAFAQKAATPKPDKGSLATENVKQLLLLMDTDKNGKISKQEWTSFMAAEFDRLDTDKSGELDPKELIKSRVSVKQFRFADQGK
jgi:Ca2+-binding EF-hand superfamily protein